MRSPILGRHPARKREGGGRRSHARLRPRRTPSRKPREIWGRDLVALPSDVKDARGPPANPCCSLKSPTMGEGGGCSSGPTRDLQKLKQQAMEYYRENDVPRRLEELLNSTFYLQPADVYGHLVGTWDKDPPPSNPAPPAARCGKALRLRCRTAHARCRHGGVVVARSGDCGKGKWQPGRRNFERDCVGPEGAGGTRALGVFVAKATAQGPWQASSLPQAASCLFKRKYRVAQLTNRQPPPFCHGMNALALLQHGLSYPGASYPARSHCYQVCLRFQAFAPRHGSPSLPGCWSPPDQLLPTLLIHTKVFSTSP